MLAHTQTIAISKQSKCQAVIHSQQNPEEHEVMQDPDMNSCKNQRLTTALYR
jgi:hypothetical protein